MPGDRCAAIPVVVFYTGHMVLQRHSVVFFLCLLGVGLPVHAQETQTVYRTLEDGVPSFSDAPPDDSRDVETITLRVPEPAEDPQLEERLEQMREATDRMAEDRREREAQRLAVREARLERERERAERSPQVIVANSGYWPVYRRPGYPGLRPPYRPKPTPLPQPGWSVMTGSNAQLMRPIVSGRR